MRRNDFAGMDRNARRRVRRDAGVRVLSGMFLSFVLIGLPGCGGSISGLPVESGGSPIPPGDPAYPTAVQVKYLGAGSVLIKRGDDSLLTAPFFSNPSMLRVAFGEIRSLPEQIDRFVGPTGGKDLAGATAVLVGHAHYDHLMDVPYIKKKYLPHAKIYGSETTKNTLAGDSTLKAARRRVRRDGRLVGSVPEQPEKPVEWWPKDPRRLRFMALKSEHAPSFAGLKFFEGHYRKPLQALPTSAWDWREGPDARLPHRLPERGWQNGRVSHPLPGRGEHGPARFSAAVQRTAGSAARRPGHRLHARIRPGRRLSGGDHEAIETTVRGHHPLGEFLRTAPGRSARPAHRADGERRPFPRPPEVGPLRRGPLQAAGARHVDATMRPEGSAPDAVAPRVDSARILVVDDQADNVQLLADLLSVHGYTVESALSGQGALDSIDRSAPDLVLLDVVMPGLSGLQVLRRAPRRPAIRDAADRARDRARSRGRARSMASKRGPTISWQSPSTVTSSLPGSARWCGSSACSTGSRRRPPS